MLEKYKFTRSRVKNWNYKKISFTLFNNVVEKIKNLVDTKQVLKASIVNQTLEEYFQEYQGFSDINAEN